MPIIYTFFSLVLTCLLLTSYSGGPAASANADFSGSPLSNRSCGSSGCHSSGNYQTEVNAQLLDGATPVDVYEPGESYTLRITISAQGNPAAYGFQAVALAGEGNEQAGAFDSAPDGFRVVALDGRQYIEHSSPRDANVLNIEWTAPAAGTGEVRFFAGGNAANGNGTNSGDSGARLSAPLVIGEAATSNIFRPEQLEVDLRVYPNPAATVVNVQLENAEAGNYMLRLLDLQGRVLAQREVQVNGGSSTERIDLSALPQGQYAIQLTDGRRVAVRQISRQ